MTTTALERGQVRAEAKAAPVTAVTSNPAAVGLAAFGGTTLLLQFANLGWASNGVVLWMAMFFGGLAQLIAGLQEFRTGNNFGYAAFTTYGAFWLTIGGILFGKHFNIIGVSTTDIGWTLLVFTFLTAIFLVGAVRQNTGVAMIFLTLLIGFILLDIGHLVSGAAVFTKIGAYELLLCVASAWYMMAHVTLSPLGINLPAGHG